MGIGGSGGAKGRQRERRRRVPRKATPERLEKAALSYLERFASSADNLRRVLMRRVERSARVHGTDREAGAEWVDGIVARLQRAGLVDDRVYAEGRALALFRRGASRRLIRHQLAAKGVGEDDIAAALAALEDEAPDPDLAAAAAYARRRRRGPYRAQDRAEHRERDMAALARQGFSLDSVRAVVDAESPDALEAQVAGDGTA